MKYLVLTHGHNDHFGGAKYLQDTYHPRVLMSAVDWDMVARLPPEAVRQAGDRVRLRPDLRRMHLFNPATGMRI